MNSVFLREKFRSSVFVSFADLAWNSDCEFCVVMQKFTTDWKRFAVGGQVCRAPEAFLVADHVDFVAAAKLDFTAIPTEQDELVKQKWRQKVEAQRKHWKDEDAKPK